MGGERERRLKAASPSCRHLREAPSCRTRGPPSRPRKLIAPSYTKSTPPDPPEPPWTVAFAQVVLGIAARSILSAVDLLERVHAGLPEPPDLADRQEGRKPYDQATDILATIECVLADNLRPAVEALHRSAQITDAELEAQYREWLKRRLDP